MSYLAIITSYAAMSYLLIYASSQIKAKEMEIVRYMLFFYGVANALLLAFYPLIIGLHPADITKIQPITSIIFTVNAIFLVLFIWLFGFSNLLTLMNYMKDAVKSKKR